MKLSHFNYDLPEGLLAEYPSEHRDEAKLMVLHRDTEKIEHKTFKDLVDYFDEGDILVFNNTKVFPARLYGNKEKTGARIEVFLLRLTRPERSESVTSSFLVKTAAWSLKSSITPPHAEEHFAFYMTDLTKNSARN